MSFPIYVLSVIHVVSPFKLPARPIGPEPCCVHKKYVLPSSPNGIRNYHLLPTCGSKSFGLSNLSFQVLFAWLDLSPGAIHIQCDPYFHRSLSFVLMDSRQIIGSSDQGSLTLGLPTQFFFECSTGSPTTSMDVTPSSSVSACTLASFLLLFSSPANHVIGVSTNHPSFVVLPLLFPFCCVRGIFCHHPYTSVPPPSCRSPCRDCC